MTDLNIDLPPEYSTLLRKVTLQETRSNEEILASLSKHAPITSEKNIWAFWDKGLDAMPSWTQRNICDWVRISSNSPKSWTVRILDSVPNSPNNALNWIPANMLPQTFTQNTMTGPYTGPHSADFLRGALLYLYGGVFMDVSNILIRNLDRIGWSELTLPSSPFRIAVPVMYAQCIANHFVMARKSDPFIKRWHDLFMHLWENRTTHEGIMESPLLAFAREMDKSEIREAGFKWKWNIPPAQISDYICQIWCFMRVALLEDVGDGFSGSAYWQEHIYGFKPIHECFGAEATIGFNGPDVYAALATRRDADPESEAYRKAYGLVWRLLSESSIQKLTHAKDMTVDKHLGTLWDEEEGKDVEPGTFAELLRWGTTHVEQVREEIVRAEMKPGKQTLRKGLLEP